MIKERRVVNVLVGDPAAWWLTPYRSVHFGFSIVAIEAIDYYYDTLITMKIIKLMLLTYIIFKEITIVE